MSKRSFYPILILIVGLIFVFGDAFFLCAQESTSEEFTLEEITVTAEKRSVSIQSLPASVVALEGSYLAEQGKVTVAEILESVPNLVYNANPSFGRGQPTANITIRGIKRTQEAGGPGPIPAATSTYVDGIFEGTGYDYDIDRIEVLRGPQGTLYGRSATGGVVAFYTKNPKLGELGGNIMLDFGSGDRMNAQVAINVPAGDKVALRAAFNYLNQDKGYRFDDKGKGKAAKEARIKALFQPTEQFSALLSLSMADYTNKTGGWTYIEYEPNKIIYNEPGHHADIGDDIPYKYRQGSLELNYDLGESALSYIGAIHTQENLGDGGYNIRGENVQYDKRTGKPNKTQTHELRWISDTEGPLSWLIGTNYYTYNYKWENIVWQHEVIGQDDPNLIDAPIFGQWNKGDIKDYGIFTEETYNLRDDMRLTAGMRYDKTKLNTYVGYDFNMHIMGMYALNPPDMLHFPSNDQTYELHVFDFNNITYKLRFEYDLTPENMLYALTATGFLPGTAIYSSSPQFGPTGFTGVVNFIPFILEQEKLTSYEVGTKNRFLDNRLQVNGAVFYEDYEGYQEAINIIPPGVPAPPSFALVAVPVRMFGLEADVSWLLTQYDKVTLTAGWLDAKVKSYPMMPDPQNPDQSVSVQQFVQMEEIPGLPKMTANLSYDHTFMFGNGSSLVPRAELRYTSGYYLGNVNLWQLNYKSWLYQDSVVLLNLGATWNSPQDNYKITGYVRNATDKLYKTGVSIPQQAGSYADVTVGDPRTYGVTLSVNF
jgi:outer membrane receptor protein involved in Fe transport